MINTIDLPNEFLISWRKHAKVIEGELFHNWKNLSEYTSLIQNNENCLLAGISKDLGLEYRREYYSIDAVFYDKYNDKVPNLNENWVWLRNIKIAFEHEHDSTSTYQEISHLAITNCELRVLVTYPWMEEDKLLKSYTEIIRRNTTLQADNSFLVIFGYEDNGQKVAWDAFIYRDKKWYKL